MADDIVNRLREKYLGQLPIVLEAADEIERLRATNTEVNLTELHSLRDQLKMAQEARARWEGTANLLAGEIQKMMGTADMYRQYESHVIHWAWEQTDGSK